MRVAGVALGVVALIAVACLRLAPLPPFELAAAGAVIVDAAGNVIERDGRAGLRIPVALDRVAPVAIQATVSAEDRRFWQHPGVDPLAAVRAVARAGEQRSGASTITQQLARRLYLDGSGDPLALRKAREAVLALQLEAHRSKRAILGLYLNDIYYGRGAYGIEAAARAYFGTSAADLDLARAAFLAGLPQRPTAYDPSADPSLARARQAYVLDRMVADGAVTRAEADAAARAPLPLAPAREPVARHFVAQAKAELAALRPDLAARRDVVIETTLDLGLQLEVERLARAHVEALAGRNVTAAALVAVEPGTGRVLALVGNSSARAGAHASEVDLTRAARQPGSALKPFLYAAALERGFTAATPLLDVPTAFATRDGPYTPFNFDRAFRGVVPLRTALASSLNVPAVRTLDAIGLGAMLEVAHRFGLGTLSETERYGLSLALGGGEVRLLDLTAAYAALAAGGEHAPPNTVARVRDPAGRVLYERSPVAPRRVLAPQHAYVVADMLSDRDARIPGFGETTPLDLPFTAAAKTGTTTGYRDNWTLGFVPEVAIGVWVGNADGSAMVDVTGIDGAAPLWRDAMSAAALSRALSWYARPANVVERTVCAPTGLLPGPDCASPVREVFVAGTEPAVTERYFARDAQGRLTIDPPTEARAWARDAGVALASSTRAALEPVRIVSPASGTVLWLAPELERQVGVFRAAASPDVLRLSFLIDGELVGEADADDAAVTWPLTPGSHTLVVRAHLRDGSVASAASAYEVRR